VKRLLLRHEIASLAEVATLIEALGWKSTLPLDLTQLVEVNIVIAQAWRDHGPPSAR